MANTSNEINSDSKDIAVRVAARIRPIVPREIREGCQECLDVAWENPQVIVRGSDKAFTFDYAFPTTSSQEYVYNTAVAKMVKELFKGYNVTILAYGQTGSGKTYTMGTSHISSAVNEAEIGVIPRAVKDIFAGIAERTDDEILVKVSFIELYKENLYDLLNTKNREETIVDIREGAKGDIVITGLTEIPVTSLEETMKCLEHGAMNRATGATAMNARSSRSHAIFSLSIDIGNKLESDNVVSAKFHLVDLAGSERAKKTKAIGERFKEGVNINKGLLSLGNVISALGAEGAKGHIPYRDSKLTRLLQDSLGGNSHTLMLACVSPADSNLEETLSTLRYADRARKIKNKPVINRDPQAAELVRLRQQVQQLQVQLLSSQSGQGNSSSPTSNELNTLLNQVQILEDENEKLMKALQSALDENTNMAEKALMAEMARDQMKTRLEELCAQTGNAVDVMNQTLNVSSNPQFHEQVNLVKDLQRKIMNLQADQQRREKAIVDHELSRHSVALNTTESLPGTSEGSEMPEGDEQSSPIKGEFGAAFTLRQAKLTEELQDLNRALAMKEELMTKMTTNDARFIAMRSSYERNLKDMEDQINQLQKERDELSQRLRSASHQNGSNKIAEQRRKRLQELEGLISGMRRKIEEQNKLMKMKEQSEHKVIQLKKEIQDMKSVRVKLIRQMKEDNEKFRKWKMQKDREVAKLKEADRKKQFQIVKMERLHSKQQNVLKRKMEEAVAINKRLKDAMALQKACQEKRQASKDIGNVASRINGWLEGELEVVTVKNQAKKSLQVLIDDRKVISEQLNKVKRQLEKKEFSQPLQEELKRKKENLERDLELRTAQINDLQMKVVEDDTGAETKKRFDSVQSMVEAKCAMQYLFQAAAQSQTSVASLEMDLKELNNQYDDLCQHMQETEDTLKALKEKHEEEISKISSDHQDKILFLLRQMPQTGEEEADSGNDDLMKRLQFQEKELARLSHLNDLLQQKSAECEELQKQLKEASIPTVSLWSQVVENCNSETAKGSNKSGMKRPAAPPKPSRISGASDDDSHEYSDNDSESSLDDNDDEDDEEGRKIDPDWRKTPLFKRIRQITRRGTKKLYDSDSSSKSDQVEGDKSGVKRTSSGDIRCGCSKNCASKICKCRKNGSSCCQSCRCNVLKCINRSTPDNSNSSSPAVSIKNETFLNSTFDVTTKEREPLSEISANKKIKVSNAEKLQTKEMAAKHSLFASPYSINIDELNFSMPPL